jgi:hypothetical protein
MTVLTPSKRAVIDAAQRHTLLSRRLGRRNLDEAVSILRRRGSDKDRKLLERAGFHVREYELRPKSERRRRA